MIITDFKQCLQNLADLYEQNESTIDYLREKLASYNKDKEIAERNQKINSLYHNSLCIMTDFEVSAKKEFISKHYKSCKNSNHYIYDLTETGIGTGIIITCPKCGETKELTDSGKW